MDATGQNLIGLQFHLENMRKSLTDRIKDANDIAKKMRNSAFSDNGALMNIKFALESADTQLREASQETTVLKNRFYNKNNSWYGGSSSAKEKKKTPASKKKR